MLHAVAQWCDTRGLVERCRDQHAHPDLHFPSAVHSPRFPLCHLTSTPGSNMMRAAAKNHAPCSSIAVTLPAVSRGLCGQAASSAGKATHAMQVEASSWCTRRSMGACFWCSAISSVSWRKARDRNTCVPRGAQARVTSDGTIHCFPLSYPQMVVYCST